MKLKELIIEISYNCNLSCIMCGFGQQAFDIHNFMTFEMFKKIVDELANKTDIIRLNGRGESVIHPDFEKMLDYVGQNFTDKQINLFTNLSYHKNDIIEKFIKYNVQLFISIDSNIKSELETIRKGSNYNIILNNLQQLQTINKRPFIVFTIQELNIDRIKSIANFALVNNCHILYNTVRRDTGIEKFENIVKQNIDNIKQQFLQVESIYKNTKLSFFYPNQIAGIKIGLNKTTKTHGEYIECPLLDKELCILYDGDVTPCNMFNPYIYGNIKNENIENIWNGQKRIEFIKNHKSHYYCKNCANLGM